jgi:hypothetical protein
MALVRFYQEPKREAIARLVNPLDDLSQHQHHWHTNIHQVFEDLTPASCAWLGTVRIGEIAKKRISGKNSARAPVTITSFSAQIDSLANGHAEAQIAAGRVPRTMGLNL